MMKARCSAQLLHCVSENDRRRAVGLDKIMERKQPLPLEHWGLERWPFRSVPDEDQLYPTAAHHEALARIDYLVAGRRRMGALVGEAGVGKSLVLRSAVREQQKQGRAPVLVDALGRTPRELLWQFAAGLGAAPSEDADVARLWRLLADRVVENRVQQIHTVLLVDDAGQAGADVLMQFVRLARLDISAAAQWTIVLAAEPRQAARWDETLRNLVDLRIELGAWTRDDTVGYVQTALVDAGRFEPLFDDDALAALHNLTGGVPRNVARLADFALLAGAAAGFDSIDAMTVETAQEELTWPAAVAGAF
jgi:general secretion pathway protein A